MSIISMKLITYTILYYYMYVCMYSAVCSTTRKEDKQLCLLAHQTNKLAFGKENFNLLKFKNKNQKNKTLFLKTCA